MWLLSNFLKLFIYQAMIIYYYLSILSPRSSIPSSSSFMILFFNVFYILINFVFLLFILQCISLSVVLSFLYISFVLCLWEFLSPLLFWRVFWCTGKLTFLASDEVLERRGGGGGRRRKRKKKKSEKERGEEVRGINSIGGWFLTECKGWGFKWKVEISLLGEAR